MYDATLGRFIQRDPVGHRRGVGDLYDFVSDSPTNAFDPSGLSPVVGPGVYLTSGTNVGGNKYGTFFMDAKSAQLKDEPFLTYGLQARIYFKPTKRVCCGEIAFIQVVRTITASTQTPLKKLGVAPMDEEGWHVDNGPGRRYGWYGYGAPWLGWFIRFGPQEQSQMAMRAGLYFLSGAPKREVKPLYGGQIGMAILGDYPRVLADERQEFITCAVCRHGNDVRVIYGCIKWGHELDAKGNYGQLKTEFVGTPGREFWSAIGAWNADAEANKEKEEGRIPIGVPEPIPVPPKPE